MDYFCFLYGVSSTLFIIVWVSVCISDTYRVFFKSACYVYYYTFYVECVFACIAEMTCYRSNSIMLSFCNVIEGNAFIRFKANFISVNIHTQVHGRFPESWVEPAYLSLLILIHLCHFLHTHQTLHTYLLLEHFKRFRMQGC